MSDILVRDVAEATVTEIDRRAAERGLSRADYLRRHLHTEFRPRSASVVTPTDWHRFHDATADLDNPDVMGGAWS